MLTYHTKHQTMQDAKLRPCSEIQDYKITNVHIIIIIIIIIIK